MREDTKKLIEKKVYAFMCMFMIISMTFTSAYALAPEEKQKETIDIANSMIKLINYLIPGAMAAETGCCVKTNTNEYCVENAVDTACSDASLFYSGSSCSAGGVEGCKIGTCIEENGICSTYKSEKQCTDGQGYFSLIGLEGLDACKPGCCQYKRETGEIAFTEWKHFQKGCEKSATKYNMSYEVSNDDAKTCAAMVPAETKGYCWLAASCFYGKKSDCPEEGVFKQPINILGNDSNRCPNCPTLDTKKCSNGDVYAANTCGELSRNPIESCTTGSKICNEGEESVSLLGQDTGLKIAAHCADITCRINITATTLWYDTGWLKAGEVGVFGKTIFATDSSGNKIPAKKRVGDFILLKPGESICVQYQGPGESHQIYVCNNDGTTGIVEAGALTPVRNYTCYYNFAIDAADKKINNYGSCKECNSRTLPQIPHWLDTIMTTLGVGMLNPEWWDYYAVTPGYCDKTQDCERLGDCVRTDTHDCVPRYTPGNQGICSDCMDNKAANPFKKCDKTDCNSRGYCKWEEKNLDMTSTALVCGVETLTGVLMTEVVGTMIGWFENEMRAINAERAAADTANGEVQAEKTRWQRAWDAIKTILKTPFRLAMRGINSILPTSTTDQDNIDNFFGWKSDKFKGELEKSESLAKTKDGYKSTLTKRMGKDSEVIYKKDTEVTQVIAKEGGTYYIRKDGSVSKAEVGTALQDTEIPKSIKDNINTFTKYTNAEATYAKNLVGYNGRVNEIFEQRENDKIIVKNGLPRTQVLGLSDTLELDAPVNNIKGKDNTKLASVPETSVNFRQGEKITVKSNGNGKYTIEGAAYQDVKKVGEVGIQRSLTVSEAEVVDLIKNSDRRGEAALAVLDSQQAWRYSDHYGGAFYEPIRTQEVTAKHNVGKIVTDYIKLQGGWMKFMWKRFSSTASNALLIKAIAWAFARYGATEVAVRTVTGYFNPAYYIKMGVCFVAQGFLYPYDSCMVDNFGVPFAVCNIQTMAMTGGDGLTLNVCSPTNPEELSPWDGFDHCYLCNEDPNRACTDVRCYSLSKQGPNGCSFDTLTAMCKPNEDALRACTQNVGTEIKIESIVQASKVATNSWKISGLNYSANEFPLIVTTNKYAECRYSNVKTTPFDKMTNMADGGNRSLNGKTNQVLLNIKSVDVKDSNFTYYLQCRDICVEAARTLPLQEINIFKKMKEDADGPVMDVSQQYPQPDEIIEGDPSGVRNVLMKVVTDEAAKCWYGRYKMAEGSEGFAEGMSEYNKTVNMMIEAGKTEAEIIAALQQVISTPIKMNKDSTGKKHSDNLQNLENGKTYAYLVKCNDTGNHPSLSHIVKFKVSEFVEVTIVKPAGMSDDPRPEIEVKTDRSTTCRYSINPTTAFSAMELMTDEAGGVTHTATFKTDLTYTSHKIYVSCLDEIGSNIGKKEGGFSITKDLKKPEVARAYYENGALILVTNEPTTCQFSSSSEFTVFGTGSDMVPIEASVNHQADWPEGRTEPYYLICKDRIGNLMSRFTVNPLASG